MRKILLFILLFSYTAIIAQNSQNLRVQKVHKAKSQIKQNNTLGSIDQQTDYQQSISKEEYLSTVSAGDSIGFTVYDWQSNNSMLRRLHLEEDGTLHAVWGYGLFDDAFPGRGTAYNVRTNGVWGDIPSERIEDARTGWPTIGVTASGRVHVLTHAGGNGMYFVHKDDGDNNWTNSIVLGDPDAVWSRSATDGEKIFGIASRTSVFGGLNNGLALQRSMDGGDNWDGPFTIDILTDYYGGVTVDCYDIAASNGVLAIVLGGYGRQTVVFKSTDDGDTWEAIPLAVTTAPFIADVSTAVPEFAPVNLAENVSLVVDDSGQIHVAGAWVFNFADPNTAPSYLSDRGGILYWTEGMDGMELIGNTVAQDWDGNGSNDYDAIDQATGNVIDLEVGWRFYSNVPVAMPSISVDEEGNPFITYTSVVDAHFHDTDLTNVETYFREVFIVKGDNSGGETSWEGPYNVSDDANTEDVFPSLPTRIYDGEVNIMYMSDSESGTGLQQDHGWRINGMKLVTIDASEIVTPDYTAENNGPNLDLFWTSFSTPQGCVLEASDIPGATAWDFPDGDLTDDVVLSDIDYNVVNSTTDVVFTVTDSDNNMAQDSMEIIIVDDVTDPEITLLCPDGTPGCASQTFNTDSGPYVDPGFIFFDDCPSLDESSVVITPSFNNGIYILTYSSTDFAGNTTTVVREITLIGNDPNAPLIGITGPDGSEITDGGTYVFETDLSTEEVPLDFIIEDDVIPFVPFSIEYGENGMPQAGVLGDYTVTVTSTDGTNTTVSTFIVSVVDTTPPTIELAPDTEIEYSSCAGDGMTLVDIAAALSTTDNFTMEPSLNVTDNVNFDQPGTYTATYSFIDESENESDPIEITYVVGDPFDVNDSCFGSSIENIALNKAIRLLPNPTDGIASLRINGDYSSVNVTVVDVQGKEIMNLKNQYGIIRLDLSSMASGIYYVKVQTDIATAVKKLIVE